MDRRAFLASSACLAMGPGALAPVQGAQSDPDPDPAFSQWKSAFISRAGRLGLPEAGVIGALADVTPNRDVVAHDRRQPEFTKPISGYLAASAGPERTAEARSRLEAARAWLDPIAAAYRTGPEILIAIWAIESSFGRIQGEDDVIRSMATLAAEGRRQAFAESELVGALRILFSGEVTRAQLKGSWAGAMGQTQFTPLDYLDYAVDADGDGRRDIWGSSADALASTANFLTRKANWLPGGRAQAEALLPDQDFDFGLLEGPIRTPASWAAYGVRPARPEALSPVDEASGASLIAPMGWKGPAFFAFANHRAIKVYNNSTAYALAVGLLAAGVAGAPGLVKPWPEDQPISLNDRMAAQEALRRAGLYSGASDGLFGADTRRAARAWQARQGLPADGYLSYDLVQRLKADPSGPV